MSKNSGNVFTFESNNKMLDSFFRQYDYFFNYKCQYTSLVIVLKACKKIKLKVWKTTGITNQIN